MPRIDGLPAADALSGSEPFAMMQGGVTKSATPEQLLAFFLASGALDGIGGGIGPGFNLRGNWAPNAAYSLGDLVTYQGSSYAAYGTFTSTTTFNAANWQLIAAAATPIPAPHIVSYAYDTAGNLIFALSDGTKLAPIAPPAGGGTAPPTALTVTGITLSPSSGMANSVGGTVIGGLNATTNTGAALINPKFVCVNSAGGDFQVLANTQAAFLPSNVPAGTYTPTFQVSADNLSAPSAVFPVSITIVAATTTAPFAWPMTFAGAAGTTPAQAANVTNSNPPYSLTVDGNNNLNVPNGAYDAAVFTAPGILGDGHFDVAFSGGSAFNIFARSSLDMQSRYLIVINGDGSVAFLLVQGGSGGSIGSNAPAGTISSSTTSIGLDLNGSTITLRVNGANTSTTWTETTLKSGYIGIAVNTTYTTKISSINSTQVAIPTSAGAHFVLLAKNGGRSGQTVQASAIPSGAGWADGLTLTPILTGALAGATVNPATISPTAGSMARALFTVMLPSASSQVNGTVDVSAARSLTTPTSYSPSGAAPTSLGAQRLTVNPVGASAVKVDDFTLTNWGSVSSAGMARIGVLFAKGLVPAGTSLDLRRAGASVAYQADERSTWSDGSLKRATVHLRDSPIAAGTVNSYEWWTAPGVDWANAGSKTLADLASYDLRADIANLTQTADGTTYTAVGSGSFLSQFNAYASVATRIEKHHSGSIVDGWVVWGMARDTTGGAEDAHLKANWHVDIWKNADGSVAAVEAAPEMAQDWWSIPNKYVRKYDLTFKANGTAVVTYMSNVHPYHSHWIAGLNDQSGNRGRRPWIGASMPTLLYTHNKANWTKAGLPSIKNTSRADVPNAQNLNYVPCGAADQRSAIDGTGAYNGRGVMPNVAMQCFARPSVQNAAAARINGLAGLGFFGQFRSNRQRIRPDDTTYDTANTIIATKMNATNGVSLPSDDFRATGMPQAVDASADYRTDASLMDKFVFVNGGGPGGPAGVWSYAQPGADGSHAANYAGWSWLYEGERYFYEATLSGAMNLVNGALGGFYGCAPSLQGPTTLRNNGAPAVQYSSIACLAQQERSTGWGINNTAWAAGFAPDAHPTAPFIRRFSAQQTAYLQAVLQWLPASEKAAGISPFGNSGDAGISSPWMTNFSVVTGQFAARVTEDAGYKAWADMMANQVKHQVAKAPFLTGAYRALVRQKAQPWAAGVNEAVTPSRMAQGYVIAQSAGSAVRQMDGGVAPTETWSTVGVGSEVYPMSHNGDGANAGVAASITDGTIYYVISVTNQGTDNPTVVLNTKADGSGTTPNFAANDGFTTAVFGSSMASQTVASGPPATANADDYQAIAYAALQEDLRANAGTADPSLVSKQGTYVGTPLNYSTWATWDYDGAP